MSRGGRSRGNPGAASSGRRRQGMKIGVLQINPVAGDVRGNAAALVAAARKAAALGAELCITSELALCAHPPSDMLLRESFIVECGQVLRKTAETLHADGLPPLLLGAPVANPVLQGKSLHNGAVLLRDGKVIVISRKVLLPCEDTLNDTRYFEPGVACGMVQYKGWRLAVTIGEDVCNDRTFWQGRRTYEVDPVADFMTGGADGLINLTALPYQSGGAARHERMLSWSAVRYRVPLICVNQAGGQDGLVYEGKSALVNAFGMVTARAAAFAEDLLLVDLIKPGEEAIPEHLTELEELWLALVTGLRDFVRKCGFSQAVLGLSGGIDSALVAALAVEALGAKNVLGVLLPSPYTSRDSIEAAQDLARNLGIESRALPITPVMGSFDAALAPLFADCPRDVTEENIQARIRGVILMALSNKFGKMLLNTGNKSESAVGYSTLYGDSCGALAVIGDVYKTQVYSLARWHNEKAGYARIPALILERAPSAELRPDQKDQDSLPPYDELDRILCDHIERNMGPDTLIEVGHDPKTVARVVRMVAGAEFKRRQSPPVLRVTARAFGDDWRMGIALRPDTRGKAAVK